MIIKKKKFDNSFESFVVNFEVNLGVIVARSLCLIALLGDFNPLTTNIPNIQKPVCQFALRII